MIEQISFLPPPTLGEVEADECYTPAPVVLELARRYCGAGLGFTLDPCAPSAEVAKAPTWFNVHQNGLAQSWRGHRVFCNPPYSDLGRWVEKCTAEVLTGGALLVVALVPAWTDRAWWHRWVEPGRHRSWPRVDFLPGRITFGGPGAEAGHNATFASAVLVWRP